jgi:hypothetical protein
MNKAYFIPLLCYSEGILMGSRGVGKTLYFLVEPCEGNHWVVSSKVNLIKNLGFPETPLLQTLLGYVYEHETETLIFPSNEKGEIVSYSELAGLRNSLNDEEVLLDLGYKVSNHDELEAINKILAEHTSSLNHLV